MPGGRTKFQDKWLETHDTNGDVIESWCAKGKTEMDAICLLCKCNLSVSNGGIAQILQHASRQKHIKARQLMKRQKTLIPCNNISNTSSNCSSVNPRNLAVALTMDQQVLKAEALWAIKVAISDFSFESSKDIVPLFALMFNNNETASRMRLGDRKLSYIISHGLGPHFHNETVFDLKSAIDGGGYLTLSFDEATTSQVRKQLDIHLRYWSPKSNSVVTSYYTSLFFGHADAKLISQRILETLKAENINLKKILMLSMDGPKVNLLVLKKINYELIKLGSKELVDISTCSLHKVHNCFSKALGDLPLDIDEFCVDLFSFFKYSAACREDLQKLQSLLECEEKFLIRHVDSRWLTLGPVISRLLVVYESLKEYFLKFLPKQKNFNTLQNNARYNRIVKYLKRTDTLVFLEFVSFIAPNLEGYLELFQAEGPLIHILYSKMNKLLRNILLMFLKEEIAGNLEGQKFLDIDFDNFKNYKTLDELSIGMGTEKALMLVKEYKIRETKMALRSCMVQLAKLLKNAFPLTNPLLRDLEILHPSMKNKHPNAIQRICVNMKPLNIEDKQMDKIILEWQAYKVDSEVNEICKQFNSSKEQRIDEFWKKVLDLKDIFTTKPRFPNLAILIKNCLILAHENADVKRGFSLNNNILTKKRLNMSESSIIGLRNIKDAAKRYGGIFSIPMTGKLLNSVAKSYSFYAAEKESKAKAVEEEKKKRKFQEEEKVKEEQKKKHKSEMLEKIQSEKKTVKYLQEELNAANKCLTESNNILREALKLNDFIKVRIVSKKIETSTNNIQTITKELSTAQEKLNNIQQST